jgi:hypothetical protein
MVSQCTNPECNKPLTYLDNGRVIRTVEYKEGRTEIQHFWLCGECYKFHDFFVSVRGGISCVRRANALAARKEYYSRPELSGPIVSTHLYSQSNGVLRDPDQEI